MKRVLILLVTLGLLFAQPAPSVSAAGYCQCGCNPGDVAVGYCTSLACFNSLGEQTGLSSLCESPPPACVRSCACARNTCQGRTCSNGCGGRCSGTLDCSAPEPTTVPGQPSSTPAPLQPTAPPPVDACGGWCTNAGDSCGAHGLPGAGGSCSNGGQCCGRNNPGPVCGGLATAHFESITCDPDGFVNVRVRSHGEKFSHHLKVWMNDYTHGASEVVRNNGVNETRVEGFWTNPPGSWTSTIPGNVFGWQGLIGSYYRITPHARVATNGSHSNVTFEYGSTPFWTYGDVMPRGDIGFQLEGASLSQVSSWNTIAGPGSNGPTLDIKIPLPYKRPYDISIETKDNCDIGGNFGYGGPSVSRPNEVETTAIFCPPAYQTISGSVIDAKTKVPLPNIEVRVWKWDTTLGQHVIGTARSDASGRYNIPNIVRYGDAYAVRVDNGIPAAYGKVRAGLAHGGLGWTWQYHTNVSLQRNTNGSTDATYEYQIAGLNDCNGPAGPGNNTRGRCDFRLYPYMPLGGQVVDTSTGAGVGGVKITAYKWVGQAVYIPDTYTDGSGYYNVPNFLVYEDGYSVNIDPATYAGIYVASRAGKYFNTQSNNRKIPYSFRHGPDQAQRGDTSAVSHAGYEYQSSGAYSCSDADDGGIINRCNFRLYKNVPQAQLATSSTTVMLGQAASFQARQTGADSSVFITAVDVNGVQLPLPSTAGCLTVIDNFCRIAQTQAANYMATFDTSRAGWTTGRYIAVVNSHHRAGGGYAARESCSGNPFLPAQQIDPDQYQFDTMFETSFINNAWARCFAGSGDIINFTVVPPTCAAFPAGATVTFDRLTGSASWPATTTGQFVAQVHRLDGAETLIANINLTTGNTYTLPAALYNNQGTYRVRVWAAPVVPGCANALIQTTSSPPLVAQDFTVQGDYYLQTGNPGAESYARMGNVSGMQITTNSFYAFSIDPGSCYDAGQVSITPDIDANTYSLGYAVAPGCRISFAQDPNIPLISTRIDVVGDFGPQIRPYIGTATSPVTTTVNAATNIVTSVRQGIDPVGAMRADLAFPYAGGPWIKLVNGSLLLNGATVNRLPPVARSIDQTVACDAATNPCNPYMIDGSGAGILQMSGSNIDLLPGKQHSDANLKVIDPGLSLPSFDQIIQGIKQGKTVQKVTGASLSLVGGQVYEMDPGASLTGVQVSGSESAIILVDGVLGLQDNINANVVVIARTLNLTTNVNLLRGVYLADQVTMGGGAPIRVIGNLIVTGRINARRSRADSYHERPSIQIEFDAGQIVRSLRSVGTTTSEWEQVE